MFVVELRISHLDIPTNR